MDKNHGHRLTSSHDQSKILIFLSVRTAVLWRKADHLASVYLYGSYARKIMIANQILTWMQFVAS